METPRKPDDCGEPPESILDRATPEQLDAIESLVRQLQHDGLGALAFGLVDLGELAQLPLYPRGVGPTVAELVGPRQAAESAGWISLHGKGAWPQ